MELNRNVVVIAHPADSVREILSQAFDTAGFVTQATTRGEEAIRLVWEWHPVAVLLALDLKNVDGWQVADALQPAAREGVSVVAVTADGRPETRRRALSSGFTHFVTLPAPPFDVVDLIDSIREAGAAQGGSR